jgi:hypothetical protein
MKYFIVALCFLNWQSSAETNLEVLGGSITYHILDEGGAVINANKVSSDGRVIANPMTGISIVDENESRFQSVIGFVGENSVGLSMGGAMYERGYVVNHWQLGFAAGFYLQDDNAFRNAGEIPFRVTEINGCGVVPIVGAAVNYKVPLNSLIYLRINNVISPVITNTSISVGWDF